MILTAGMRASFLAPPPAELTTPNPTGPLRNVRMRKPTIVSKPASRPTLGSDLARVDAHVIKPAEYKELPELTDEMLARGVFKRGGRPRSANPRQLISLRLPAEVIARWRATGPGWQTRMAERLAKAPLPGDSEKTPAPDLALARKRRKGLES